MMEKRIRTTERKENWKMEWFKRMAEQSSLEGAKKIDRMIYATIHSHCRKLEAPPLHSNHTTKSIYSNSPLVINLIFHY